MPNHDSPASVPNSLSLARTLSLRSTTCEGDDASSLCSSGNSSSHHLSDLLHSPSTTVHDSNNNNQILIVPASGPKSLHLIGGDTISPTTAPPVKIVVPREMPDAAKPLANSGEYTHCRLVVENRSALPTLRTPVAGHTCRRMLHRPLSVSPLCDRHCSSIATLPDAVRVPFSHC